MNIFEFITTEENAYKLRPVPIVEGWEWKMYDHVKTTVLYKNSTYLTGKDDNKPFKNIIRPILNLQYRTEGFDVKDILLFVNEVKNFFKSFLVRKFHEKWARDNKIDTFIDELVESYVDFGGVLVKNVNQVRPEVVPLQRLAFCDQTDIVSGAFAEKHSFSPSQLREMEKQGWGDEKNGADGTIEDLIILSKEEKSQNMVESQKAKTPSKYIEVYEVHGTFPEDWLKNGGDPEKYVSQLQIVALYKSTDESGKDGKSGFTLFKGKEKELPYKFLARDAIYGRALGLGGAEELFEPQVWTNWNTIIKKEFLEAASKVIMKTTDPKLVARHPRGLKNLDNLEILELGVNTDISQVNTTPINAPLFDRSVAEWEAHAKQLGSASEALLGESPTSGTPFKLQELVVDQGEGLHEYRRGKIADFVAEIYRDWIIPYLSREVSKNQEFLATLDLDELQMVADSLVTCEANKMIKEKILSGEQVDDTMVEEYKKNVREEFMKGNKKFIKILEGEMQDSPFDVEVNIVGKQKNLSSMTDKLVNVIRQIIASPQILDDPRMAKLFNQILEFSGLNPMDFSTYSTPKESPEPTMLPISPRQVVSGATQ